MTKRLLVTGATGFVGAAVLQRLSADCRFVVAAGVRQGYASIPPGIELVQMDALGAGGSWLAALRGVDMVIHAAARVHILQDDSPDPLAEFRRVNVEGTLSLARQAATAGVRRFIFISSIKVNGEGNPVGIPYVADEHPAPTDPYGISKMEAEHGLRALAAMSDMEVVIIRPTLVYGPGVKANFLNMMRWLYKGIPLPFGAIQNRRSLIALDNLVDLIVTCIDHPAAANEIFLVSDGDDLSTTELMQRMGAALGKPARLLPVHSRLLEIGAAMLGKKALSQRLCGSLQVDIGKTRELLNWTPPVSVEEALHKTAKHFLEQQSK